MSDKENQPEPGVSNVQNRGSLRAPSCSYGKRRKRNRGTLVTASKLHDLQQQLDTTDPASLPQLRPVLLTHSKRRDTRPVGSRQQRRARKQANDCSIDCDNSGAYDLGSTLYCDPSSGEKRSEDQLWADGRESLFEQSLRAAPFIHDAVVSSLQHMFMPSPIQMAPNAPCQHCQQCSQPVVIITASATIKRDIPFVSCSERYGFGPAAVPLTESVHKLVRLDACTAECRCDGQYCQEPVVYVLTCPCAFM